jgi:hypothetical protein
MKRSVLLFLISLLPLTHCFSQTILPDSSYVITAEQLKLTNQIFVEHEFLLNKTKLLEDKIFNYKGLVEEYHKSDSIKTLTIDQQNTSIKKLKKSIKVKNTIITGTSVGFLVSLLLLICGK